MQKSTARTKIIFFGTPEFAAPALTALHGAGFSIAAVVTQPDKPVGRGLKVEAPPVKIKAQELGLKVFLPKPLRGVVAGLQPATTPLNVFGCNPFNPNSCALIFTGGASTFSPRPTGLSGCVTTAAIEKPAPCNAVSAGAANSGVPKKIILVRAVLFCILWYDIFTSLMLCTGYR